MDGCIDCQQGFPFVKTGKAYERDTMLYECDDPDCPHKVCRRHLQSLYTLGDYCSKHAERQQAQMHDYV